MNSKQRAAFENGNTAFHEGAKETDNPYSPETDPDLFLAWNTGFNDAKEAADQSEG